MAAILVIDDSKILRDFMASALTRAGYDVLTAASASEAFHAFFARHFDLLILDIGLPEMDGLALLKHLRATEAGQNVPVILLTAHEDRESILKAAALGVRDYVLKSEFSLPNLILRVKNRLAVPLQPHDAPLAPHDVPADPAAPHPLPADSGSSSPIDAAHDPPPPPAPQPKPQPCDPSRLLLLSREQTRERLAEITAPRTCAGVVAQVLVLANSPDSTIADLVHVVESDPIIASRVLQLANSPMFRQRMNRLSSVEDAVRKIGMRAIQNMVVTIGVFQAFPPVSSDGFNTLRCWQHCFAVAAIIRELMRNHTEDQREHVALVGLCHDLGEIVLRQHFAPQYEKILRHAQQTNQPIPQVEAVALSMRHGELVNEVLTRIGLPPNVSIPIMRFHEGSTPAETDGLPVVRLLQIANSLAHGMLLAPSRDATVAPITTSDLKRALGPHPDPLDLQTLRAHVITATNLLARLPAADEARFVTPLYPPARAHVWYTRHPCYAQLDPLDEALDLMANVRREPRLPMPHELDHLDLIIVASPFYDSPPARVKDLIALQRGEGLQIPPVALFLNTVDAAAKLPNTSLLTLPVSLDILSAIIQKAALRPQPVG